MFEKKQILDYINKKRHVTNADICRQFGLSESTARRIIAQFAERGKVGRFHGGAFAVDAGGITAVTSRLDENAEKKIAIARAAAGIVTDNSTCIILSGSTVGYMCRFIKNKPITIITNSLIVFDELKNCPNVKLLVLGGLYNRDEEELGGIIPNTNLAYLRADFLFMGASCFDEKSGFINRNHSIDLYRSCLNTCDTACMLVDSSKYNSGGTSIAARPNQIRYLFTDSGLDPEVVKRFEEKGIKVVITD